MPIEKHCHLIFNTKILDKYEIIRILRIEYCLKKKNAFIEYIFLGLLFYRAFHDLTHFLDYWHSRLLDFIIRLYFLYKIFFATTFWARTTLISFKQSFSSFLFILNNSDIHFVLINGPLLLVTFINFNF